MIIKLFEEHLAQEWDIFVDQCPMSTFLHKRCFLSYHKDRFIDKSLIILDDNDKWLAVMPAAINPRQITEIVSHPGATFGGIVHKGKLLGTDFLNCFNKIILFYKEAGFSTLLYKAIPHFYHQAPAQDDLYALFRLNSTLIRRDISCTIDLSGPQILSSKDLSKMRNMIRKSEMSGLSIQNNFFENIDEFWSILTENLRLKYNTAPVHTVDEIKILKNRLSGDVECVVVRNTENKIVSGTILFHTKTVTHTQYLCVTEEGKQVFALDYLIQHTIQIAQKNQKKFFDFGINTENNGSFLNESLYKSKSKHGGSGAIHDFYQLSF